MAMNMTINKARILCVDDEPGILRALSWVLKKDYSISTATSGEEALKVLKDKDFDVIISDQRMPGMMGAELLEKASQIQPQAIRLLLTGYSDMEYVLDSINKGEIFRFIKKPWHIPELKRIVGEAVDIAIGSNTTTATPAANASNAPKLLLVDDDPEVISMVKEIMGNSESLSIATSISESVIALSDSSKIGVVISDLEVGGVDVSGLLKVLKSKAPEITTVVVSSRSDIQDVINLINQGQVYRFIFKPTKRGALKIMIQSALEKHSKLMQDPSSRRRHMVEKLDSSDFESLMRDVKKHAAEESATADLNEPGMLKRFSSGFAKLFGG
jgi:serine/threonine-protein kinase